MRVGDLVKFSNSSGWVGVRGKIGIVVAINHPRGWPQQGLWREWDCLIDGKVVEGFDVRLDDPGYLERHGVEVICG